MPRPGGTMIGSCDAMRRLFATIRKVANTDATVFVAGESGTGKELTAAAIHQQSLRADAPFVAVNCAAIPPTLLQAELFGHERGAFTGAHQRKIGRIEAAHGGTLFLDEIGDMPFESQASLLRFLQEGTIERLGGHASIPVDVRIVSATHVDLEAAMQAGRFRADLYYRCACCASTSRRCAAATSCCSPTTCCGAIAATVRSGFAASCRARSRRSTTTHGPATCAS